MAVLRKLLPEPSRPACLRIRFALRDASEAALRLGAMAHWSQLADGKLCLRYHESDERLRDSRLHNNRLDRPIWSSSRQNYFAGAVLRAVRVWGVPVSTAGPC